MKLNDLRVNTVGELKAALANIPDDMKILYWDGGDPPEFKAYADECYGVSIDCHTVIYAPSGKPIVAILIEKD